MSKLAEILAAELEHPRDLSPRVENYISDHYGIDYDGIGHFLVNDLARLEDDEIDLILSPLFTPKLADQAVIAAFLGAQSVPRADWPPLVQLLVARPTVAHLVSTGGKNHKVPLREVTIERYVYRLRLDGAIPEPVVALIETAPADDHPMLKAIARQPVWENAGASEILAIYLGKAIGAGSYSLADTLALLNLVEGRKPADLIDLAVRMPGWQEALRAQVEAGPGPKPFFNEDIRAMHGGGRDQRFQEDVRISGKKRELEFLLRLQQILQIP